MSAVWFVVFFQVEKKYERVPGSQTKVQRSSRRVAHAEKNLKCPQANPAGAGFACRHTQFFSARADRTRSTQLETR
jgi:hypothetical protein